MRPTVIAMLIIAGGQSQAVENPLQHSRKDETGQHLLLAG